MISEYLHIRTQGKKTKKMMGTLTNRDFSKIFKYHEIMSRGLVHSFNIFFFQIVMSYQNVIHGRTLFAKGTIVIK